MSDASQYDTDLDKNRANYTPLSPITFLERAAAVYPERVAQIHGEKRYSWAQTYERCRRLASALQQRGIGTDDTVALMLPNIPAMFEAHFAIPMTGAVINALNFLLNDGSFVEVIGDVMGGSANELHALVVCLVVGPRAFKTRQK